MLTRPHHRPPSRPELPSNKIVSLSAWSSSSSDIVAPVPSPDDTPVSKRLLKLPASHHCFHGMDSNMLLQLFFERTQQEDIVCHDSVSLVAPLMSLTLTPHWKLHAGFKSRSPQDSYLVLVGSAIFWQLLSLGTVGVVSCSSSLFAGVVAALLLPVGEILPVFLLDEKFNGWKAVAMALCLWGFTSYLYGEYRQHKDRKRTEPELELPAAP